MGENRLLPKHVTVKFQNPGDKHKILQGSGEQGWGKWKSENGKRF